MASPNAARHNGTRLIIPAPPQTKRDSGIVWYEAFLPTRDEPNPLDTQPSNRKVLSRLDAEFASHEH